MAKISAKVSKNQQTGRKSKISMYNGKKVKPVAWIRNPLGFRNSDGSKVPAGKLQYVQFDDGNLLKNSEGDFVLWSSIRSKIVTV